MTPARRDGKRGRAAEVCAEGAGGNWVDNGADAVAVEGGPTVAIGCGN